MINLSNKGIGYARKSIRIYGVEDEDENVLYQLNHIKDYASRHDIELTETYSDIGYSGVLKSRPELNRMLEDLKQQDNHINYLILYSSDRLARDLSTSITLMLEITELVDEIVFVAEGISTSVKNFRESFLISAARAAEERRKIKQRLRDGREAKVIFGQLYRATHKPLGYLQLKKKQLVLARLDKTRDIDLTNDLIIVQCIFIAYLCGRSFRNIADWLNQEFGLTKRGKNWDYKSVQYIIENPVYAGILSSLSGISCRSPFKQRINESQS